MKAKASRSAVGVAAELAREAELQVGLCVLSRVRGRAALLTTRVALEMSDSNFSEHLIK